MHRMHPMHGAVAETTHALHTHADHVRVILCAGCIGVNPHWQPRAPHTKRRMGLDSTWQWILLECRPTKQLCGWTENRTVHAGRTQAATQGNLQVHSRPMAAGPHSPLRSLPELMVAAQVTDKVKTQVSTATGGQLVCETRTPNTQDTPIHPPLSALLAGCTHPASSHSFSEHCNVPTCPSTSRAAASPYDFGVFECLCSTLKSTGAKNARENRSGSSQDRSS